jgi:hypothetical protein
MNEEEIKKIINDTYDESREDTLLSMTGQLYSRKMFPSFFVHCVYVLPFIAGAVFCGISFVNAQEIRFQLMFATIFICCVQFIIFSKNKYWQMLHKTNISREIKRLELRIADLSETVKNK